jgi:hypothetical protein
VGGHRRIHKQRGRACIEAQLGTSNHDHLGKLLTYIAAYDANAAVWVVGEPRPEHVQAITSLNTRFRDVDFYMVRLEVVSVGETGPKAPLFSLVAWPSPVIKTAGAVLEELAGNKRLMTEFWMALLPLAADAVPGFAGTKPRPVRRLGVTAGRKGVRFSFAVRGHDSECGLLILGGKHGDPVPAFDELAANKDAIEASFGARLDWVVGARCRVGVTLPGGYLDRDQWAPTLHPALTKKMGLLAAAVKPYLVTMQSRQATTDTSGEDDDQDDE